MWGVTDWLQKDVDTMQKNVFVKVCLHSIPILLSRAIVITHE